MCPSDPVSNYGQSQRRVVEFRRHRRRAACRQRIIETENPNLIGLICPQIAVADIAVEMHACGVDECVFPDFEPR